MRLGDMAPLRAALEAQGWEIAEEAPAPGDPDPFLVAAWRLRSCRSPRGMEAELRLFGDIPYDGAQAEPREARRPIWRLALFAPGAAAPELELRAGARSIRFSDQVAALVAMLARMRDAAG